MKPATGREKILLTLLGKGDYEDETLVPYSTCQQGLSESIDVSQPRVAQLVKKLEEKGLLKEDKKHVVGLKRRRKVYFLTANGTRKAEDCIKRLKEKEVTVETKNSEETIKLGSVDKYIDSKRPLLTALNRLNGEGKIDLTERKVRTRDVFVDREEEMKVLEQESKNINTEGRKVLFLKGEAGIGKTSLISEFRSQLTSGEQEFLSGRAYFDNAEPYLPFKEAFKKYNLDSPTEIFSFSSDEGDDIENMERQSVYYETAETVRNIASRKPLIIFFDDLQWADRSSLQLLYYLSDNIDDHPVLFICTFRPEDVSDEHPLKEIIQRMSRSHLYHEIDLDPLGWEDTEEIIINLLGQDDIPSDFVKLIHRITEGNPLFIKECTEQMLEGGIIDPKDEEYPEDKDDIEIPRIINDIIDKRIRRLDDDTRNVLDIGSVVGEDVPFSLILSVLDMDELELLNHLDILVGSDLWEDEPNEEMFYFSHGLIQLAVYENISETIRKRYHLRIAETLEKIYEDDIEDHLTSLAFHYERAGEREKSVGYYIEAGQRAKELYAHEDAIQMYEKGLDLLEAMDNSRHSEEEIKELMGDSYRVLGEYDKSRDAFRSCVQQTDDTANKARCHWKIGCTYLDQGDYELALETLDRGLKTLEEENWIKCRLLDRKGWALMREGEYEEVAPIFRGEKKVAESIDDEKEIAQALHNLGSLSLKRGRFNEAEDRFQEAIELREEIDDRKGLSSSYNNLGVVHSNRGDLESSLEYLNKSLEMVEEMGDIRSYSLTLLNIGEEYYNMGELDKALDRYNESLSVKEKIDDREGMAFCYNYIGEVYREKGAVSKARESHEKGLEIAENINNQKMVINSLLSLAQDELDRSNTDEGTSLAEDALERTKESGLKSQLSKAKRIMGKAYRLDGKDERAEHELREALDEMGDGGDKKERGKILYELGLLCADRDEENCEKYLKEASDSFQDIGMELWMEKTEDHIDSI